MSKVTIKFWYNEGNRYIDEESEDGRFVVGSDLVVYHTTPWSCANTDLEPHFCKDGERIA